MWLSVTNLRTKEYNKTFRAKINYEVPDVIPECGGPQHPQAGVDDEHEGEEENGDIDRDRHGPVLLGQEIQSSKLYKFAD